MTPWPIIALQNDPWPILALQNDPRPMIALQNDPPAYNSLAKRQTPGLK